MAPASAAEGSQHARSAAERLGTMPYDGVVTRTRRGPRSRLGLRDVATFARDPLGFLQSLQSQQGDVATVRMLGVRWILLSHPDDVETLFVHRAADLGRDDYTDILKRVLGEGLLTSDGDKWKRQRKLLSSAFTPKRIRGYADAMASVTARALERSGGGGVVNLHERMSELTLEVVADVLFGASVSEADVATVQSSMEAFNDYFAQSPEAVLRIPSWVPTPRLRAVAKARDQLDTLVFRILRERRSRPARDDLLGAMIAALDDDGSGMDDAQLRDETVTLFLAGHETTALALTHALYALARHPEIERRVVAEIREVLGDRLPTADDVPRLVLVDRVLKESMRLYPPAWVTGREVIRAFRLGELDLEVGDQVLVAPWTMHRDARHWRDPEAFDPERFSPEGSRERHRYAYLPFGGGPRTCIGNHFAMMEATILLALFVRRFHCELLPFQELRFAPAVTLRPAGEGVLGKLFPRA
jgi:cytochrome P450